MPNSGSVIIKQRILDAATDLFAASGYNGVSTRDIARTAAVNETSIYRHYPGKRELFLAALDAELSKVRLKAEQMSHLAAVAGRARGDAGAVPRHDRSDHRNAMHWYDSCTSVCSNIATIWMPSIAVPRAAYPAGPPANTWHVGRN